MLFTFLSTAFCATAQSTGNEILDANTITTAVPFLRINPDARAGALGYASIATSPDANGIFVLRKRDLEKDGIIADVYQLHAKNVAALVLAEQFELQPHDIVYVTSAPLARWNRVISLLLPSIATVDNLDDITTN